MLIDVPPIVGGVAGVQDGCNNKTLREEYALQLHPDCIFEMALSVNFAFVSTLVVMFLVGVYMVFVSSFLELHGELVF